MATRQIELQRNRLTDGDRDLIRERMARFATDYRARHYGEHVLTEGEQYGLVVRGSEAIGLTWVDLRESERAELETMAATFAEVAR